MNRRRDKLPKKWRGREREEVLEEILRPCARLGYNRDELGMYFLGREAVEIAETQFRRAVWVNPYEPLFKFHWALSLYKLRRYAQAIEQLQQMLVAKPDDADALKLLELCRQQHATVPKPQQPSTDNARSSSS
jgi:tetratricopeptide (TPR) repeat protein